MSYGLGALGVVCVVALCYFLIFWGRGKPNTVIKAKVDDFEIYLHHYESKAEPVLVYFVAGGRRRLAPPPRDGASGQGSRLTHSLSLSLPIPLPPVQFPSLPEEQEGELVPGLQSGDSSLLPDAGADRRPRHHRGRRGRPRPVEGPQASPAPPRTVQAQERAHTSKVGTRRWRRFQNRQVAGAQQHPEGRPVLREDLYGDEALRRQTPSLYNMHFSSRPTPREIVTRTL